MNLNQTSIGSTCQYFSFHNVVAAPFNGGIGTFEQEADELEANFSFVVLMLVVFKLLKRYVQSYLPK